MHFPTTFSSLQHYVWDWAHNKTRTRGTLMVGFKDIDLYLDRFEIIPPTSQIIVVGVTMGKIGDCEYGDIHMKAHDIGIPGPYQNCLVEVTENCNLRTFEGYFNGTERRRMRYNDDEVTLRPVDQLPVQAVSTLLPSPNISEPSSPAGEYLRHVYRYAGKLLPLGMFPKKTKKQEQLRADDDDETSRKPER